MHPTIRSTQVVTPFGSGYVPEDHGSDPALKSSGKRSGAYWGLALTIALFGATTAAAILTASSPRLCARAETLAAKPTLNSDEAAGFGRLRRQCCSRV